MPQLCTSHHSAYRTRSICSRKFGSVDSIFTALFTSTTNLTTALPFISTFRASHFATRSVISRPLKKVCCRKADFKAISSICYIPDLPRSSYHTATSLASARNSTVRKSSLLATPTVGTVSNPSPYTFSRDRGKESFGNSCVASQRRFFGADSTSPAITAAADKAISTSGDLQTEMATVDTSARLEKLRELMKRERIAVYSMWPSLLINLGSPVSARSAYFFKNDVFTFTIIFVLKKMSRILKAPIDSALFFEREVPVFSRFRFHQLWRSDSVLLVAVIPSEDSHQSEYIAPCDARRGESILF